MATDFDILLMKESPIVMGILNVTKDSFSDGGKFFDTDLAINQAKLLSKLGADIIDIGAESTRPGSNKIDVNTEVKRLLPIVSECASKLTLSIDTYKSEVANCCLKLGAKIINDVSGLRADLKMAKVISKHNAHIVIMHSVSPDENPHANFDLLDQIDIIERISNFFFKQIKYAKDHGINENRIILDPGMGAFLGTNPNTSFEVIRRFDELKNNFNKHKFLIATSRKSFLGGEISKRDPISQLTSLIAHSKGAEIIRTHNVEMAKEFLNIYSVTK